MGRTPDLSAKLSPSRAFHELRPQSLDRSLARSVPQKKQKGSKWLAGITDQQQNRERGKKEKKNLHHEQPQLV